VPIPAETVMHRLLDAVAVVQAQIAASAPNRGAAVGFGCSSC